MMRPGKEKVGEENGSKQQRAHRVLSRREIEPSPKDMDVEEEQASRTAMSMWLKRPYSRLYTFNLSFFVENLATQDQIVGLRNCGWECSELFNKTVQISTDAMNGMSSRGNPSSHRGFRKSASVEDGELEGSDDGEEDGEGGPLGKGFWDDKAISLGGDHRRKSQPAVGSRVFSLFIDNLPLGCSYRWVKKLFSRFGAVAGVFISRKIRRFSKNPFGFVRFCNRREAEVASMQVNGLRVAGRELIVQTPKFDFNIGSQSKVQQFDFGNEVKHSGGVSPYFPRGYSGRPISTYAQVLTGSSILPCVDLDNRKTCCLGLQVEDPQAVEVCSRPLGMGENGSKGLNCWEYEGCRMDSLAGSGSLNVLSDLCSLELQNFDAQASVICSRILGAYCGVEPVGSSIWEVDELCFASSGCSRSCCEMLGSEKFPLELVIKDVKAIEPEATPLLDVTVVHVFGDMANYSSVGSVFSVGAENVVQLPNIPYVGGIIDSSGMSDGNLVDIEVVKVAGSESRYAVPKSDSEKGEFSDLVRLIVHDAIQMGKAMGMNVSSRDERMIKRFSVLRQLDREKWRMCFDEESTPG